MGDIFCILDVAGFFFLGVGVGGGIVLCIMGYCCRKQNKNQPLTES